jgi:putative toxin-antitoxin system antitoxin component (TIGR02293 family)
MPRTSLILRNLLYLMSYNYVSVDARSVLSLEYQVGQLLGVGRKTEAEMEQAVRSGSLPASALLELVRHIAGAKKGPATTAVAQRIVSRATWNRALRSPKAKLSRTVADRVERVGQLVTHAETVWDDTDDAREFILSEQTPLDGAPLDLAADSTVGARRAEALLGRIDHGIVV